MLSARPTRFIHRLAQTSRRAPTFGAGVRHYNPDQKGDPFDQSHQAGHAARDKRKSGPLDAANPEAGKQADRGGLTGNPEGVGFADQVGSQSATGSESSTQSADAEGANGQENITPPAFLDAVKSKLGFKTTAGEDKQNRGGGKGVTGTGQVTVDRGKRTIHTSAAFRKDA